MPGLVPRLPVERRMDRDHKKIVTIGLDPMVQGPAQQAFIARPLDCPVEPGNDGEKNVIRVSRRLKSEKQVAATQSLASPFQLNRTAVNLFRP
jgi:hypothetical protein